MKLLDKSVIVIMTILGIFMIVYHMIYTQMVLIEPTQHQNLHLMCALCLVYLMSFHKEKKYFKKVIAFILILLSIYATGYIFLEYTELQEIRGPIGMLNTQDMVVATMIVVLCIEASRRAFGLAFPLVAVCFILYCFFGHMLPGAIAAPEISYMEMMTSFVMGLSGGVYGSTLSVSANYIFLFVIFGSLLSATGASQFFNRVGAAAGKRLAGGPAISSVISSALVGSITGSSLANVVTTGTFTIPLMKKAGYKPYQAGAIEAAASTGGQIMPPVMGATAFVLAEMASTPYVEVMTAAFLPALLYFLSIGIYAQLQAKKLRIDASALFSDAYTSRQIFRDAPLFLGPLGVIMALLFLGYSPMFTVFWGVMVLLLLNAFHLLSEGKFKDAVPTLIPELREGAVTGAKIAVTCALLGPIVAVMTKTSLGIRIPSIITLLCGGNVFIALIITAFVCILLGMGVPTLAAYLMVAMVGVPALVNLGVPTLAAHMYVFIFAVFSSITPPVATAAIPASGIAGSSYMKTAFEAFKVGFVAFIIPFLCVFAPEVMLGQTTAGIFVSLLAFFWGLGAVLLLSMSICGFTFMPVGRVARIVSFVIGILMVSCMFFREPWLILPAVISSFSFFIHQGLVHKSFSAKKTENAL
ncbi:TRAP transporter fused permease subunit [uncultured Mailhella sp.]|uniref:TRAP transporter permease n=1 Tax=uncultured Mailhella sp. TaxID=1981031 RepID=UPI002608436F|nr:TRAP transporter fused permease subunit [uncultured Mailhella sp.]